MHLIVVLIALTGIPTASLATQDPSTFEIEELHEEEPILIFEPLDVQRKPAVLGPPSSVPVGDNASLYKSEEFYEDTLRLRQESVDPDSPAFTDKTR